MATLEAASRPAAVVYRDGLDQDIDQELVFVAGFAYDTCSPTVRCRGSRCRITAQPSTPSSCHGMHAHVPNDDTPQVSIVIPARNEAARLPPSIRQIRSTFPDEPWEFIVVVELSTDGTLEATHEAVEGDPRFVIVANPVARGKGYAVKSGMLRARGEQVFFMDADLSVPLRYIPDFLHHAASADVLIGSRRHPDSIIRLHQPLLREAAGRFFNHALRLLGITRLTDTQCGFKAFSRAAAQAIFSRVQQDGFGFDVEAILIAQTMGLTLLELPVEWADVKGSKVSPLNGLAALRDAILAARRVRRDQP